MNTTFPRERPAVIILGGIVVAAVTAAVLGYWTWYMHSLGCSWAWAYGLAHLGVTMCGFGCAFYLEALRKRGFAPTRVDCAAISIAFLTPPATLAVMLIAPLSLRTRRA